MLCPYCAETIEEYTCICPHCESQLENTSPKLYRKLKGRRFFGVCSGLAEKFDLPVEAFRAAFLVATLFGGFGLFLYICLLLTMYVKEEDSY